MYILKYKYFSKHWHIIYTKMPNNHPSFWMKEFKHVKTKPFFVIPKNLHRHWFPLQFPNYPGVSWAQLPWPRFSASGAPNVWRSRSSLHLTTGSTRGYCDTSPVFRRVFFFPIGKWFPQQKQPWTGTNSINRTVLDGNKSHSHEFTCLFITMTEVSLLCCARLEGMLSWPALVFQIHLSHVPFKKKCYGLNMSKWFPYWF